MQEGPEPKYSYYFCFYCSSIPAKYSYNLKTLSCFYLKNILNAEKKYI